MCHWKQLPGLFINIPDPEDKGFTRHQVTTSNVNPQNIPAHTSRARLLKRTSVEVCLFCVFCILLLLLHVLTAKLSLQVLPGSPYEGSQEVPRYQGRVESQPTPSPLSLSAQRHSLPAYIPASLLQSHLKHAKTLGKPSVSLSQPSKPVTPLPGKSLSTQKLTHGKLAQKLSQKLSQGSVAPLTPQSLTPQSTQRILVSAVPTTVQTSREANSSISRMEGQIQEPRHALRTVNSDPYLTVAANLTSADNPMISVNCRDLNSPVFMDTQHQVILSYNP